MELQSIQAASATATMDGGVRGGSVTPMLLDLSNFDSIQLFVSTLLSEHYNIDILFNNAGYVPIVNDPINTKYNMESSYTSMHLGHFYLTELLIQHHPKLHVVNTSSGTHHLCGILSSKTNGCINNNFFITGLYSPSDEYAYIRSKLANVLHVLELPKVHTQVSAIAIDLGWVGTSIQPWMKGELLPTPSSLGMMRSAYIGVTPILRALLLSSHDELSSSSIGRGGGVTMNVLGQLEESFSLPWWDKDAMIQLSKRLWDESVNILSLHGHDISDGVDVVMSDEGVSDKSIIVDDDKSTPPLVIINDEIPLIDAHTAGRMGDMDALTAIGAKDIEMLNVHDNNGWTPLHEAARFGHLEAVQFLINNGLDKVSTKPLSSVSW
jgi:NAD(P)-dependent dehydrogenase (short-subunit alcohol dehydrogenase family)